MKNRRPITREDRLEIFSGPNREYRNLLENIINKKAKIDILATTKKALK